MTTKAGKRNPPASISKYSAPVNSIFDRMFRSREGPVSLIRLNVTNVMIISIAISFS